MKNGFRSSFFIVLCFEKWKYFLKTFSKPPKICFLKPLHQFHFFLQVIASLFSQKKKKLSHPCSYTKSTNLGPRKPSNGFSNPKPISHTTLSNIFPLRHRIRGIPRLDLATATARDGGAILVFGRRVERSIALGKCGQSKLLLVLLICS